MAAYLLAMALTLGARGASAQTAAESERAEKLFSEATILAQRGDFATACPKFEESQRLDPALGTLFNLALCQEKGGKLASAWRNFRAVEQLARATAKKGREDAAHQKVLELRPRLAGLTFAVREPDATVKVDGVRVEIEERSFYAVEPGEHVVEATAPAKKTWQTRVNVAEPADGKGTALSVSVPALESITGETRVVTVTTETTNTKRTVGFALIGLGVVGVGAAAVTGIILLNDHSTADERCAPTCDGDGVDAVKRGQTLLPVNAIAWGVAALGVGAGSFLVLTSGSSNKPTTARIAPMVGTDHGGARLVGTF